MWQGRDTFVHEELCQNVNYGGVIRSSWRPKPLFVVNYGVLAFSESCAPRECIACIRTVLAVRGREERRRHEDAGEKCDRHPDEEFLHPFHGLLQSGTTASAAIIDEET